MKENGYTQEKARSRRYPTQTITDMDYADEIRLLAHTPTQAESLLHSLDQGAGGIGLHVNSDKTEYMCFNQRGDISTLNGGFLKLVNKFTYFGRSVSSTENDIKMQRAKKWTAINRLSEDEDEWRERVREIGASSITWWWWLYKQCNNIKHSGKKERIRFWSSAHFQILTAQLVSKISWQDSFPDKKKWMQFYGI